VAIAATSEGCGRHLGFKNLACAPITPASPCAAEGGRTERAAPGRLQVLVIDNHRLHETAHRSREQQAVRRHLRTLCEDLDELLGRLGDAARQHHVEAADSLLVNAVAIAAELARRLPCEELRQNPPTAHIAAEVLDEVDVLRTLALLEELDGDLDRTARGERAARAPALARTVLARIDALARAAASGRTRSRQRPTVSIRSGNSIRSQACAAGPFEPVLLATPPRALGGRTRSARADPSDADGHPDDHRRSPPGRRSAPARQRAALPLVAGALGTVAGRPVLRSPAGGSAAGRARSARTG
jgi:hypothetical protein